MYAVSLAGSGDHLLYAHVCLPQPEASLSQRLSARAETKFANIRFNFAIRFERGRYKREQWPSCARKNAPVFAAEDDIDNRASANPCDRHDTLSTYRRKHTQNLKFTKKHRGVRDDADVAATLNNMAKKKRKNAIEEEPVVPPQDRRICGTICVCQMTAILSSVAIVYLSVAVYFPSMRALYSGIIEEPVMCSTSKVVTVDKCNWGSCGEWCLSKTSGACVQIYVNLRDNGSTLEFANCDFTFNKTCYGVDQDSAPKYRCKQEECKNLSGTFNCTAGVCINITTAFECAFGITNEPLNCTGNRGKINCMDIEGLNTCTRGICARIRAPYNCDRRCVDIPTHNKNVILLSGDKVFLSRCENVTVAVDNRAIANSFNSSNTLQVPATQSATATLDPINDLSSPVLWKAEEKIILLASCYRVWRRPSQAIRAVDCVNGTFVHEGIFSDFSNFTFLHGLAVSDKDRSPRERLIAPLEDDLLIANDSKLMINLEGCVNTLREECKQFLKEYGKDGADHNARARFPCYYSRMDPTMVVTRFSLEVVYREFLPAALIPLVLFVFSCLTLVLCQRTVEVGDDAKMRFKKWSKHRGQKRLLDGGCDATEIVAMTEEECRSVNDEENETDVNTN